MNSMSGGIGYGPKSSTGANLISQGQTGKYSGDRITSGYKTSQLQNYDPQQLELYQQQFQNAGPDSYLSRLAGGDQSLFQNLEAPAYQQFNEQIGNLASRFSQGGGGGGGQQALSSRRGSGFQNATSSAANNFAQQLQANRMNLQRQAQQDLQSMVTSLLGYKPYDRQLVKREDTGLDSFLGGALPIAGGLAGAYFGGIPGAKIGLKLGSAAGNSFTGQ